MGKRILGYILCILGFIVILFFNRYLGNIIPYPKMILPIGGILLVVGSVLLGATPTYRQLKAEQKLKNSSNNLIENGEKIQVDLTQCEIKENDYSEMRLPDGRGEADLSDFEASAYDEASGEKLTEID